MKCRQGHRLTFLDPDQVWAHPEPTAWCSAPPVEDEPARPEEDREPVGPYAPTRTGVPLSLAESAVLSALSDLIVNQSDRINTGLASLGNRFDGLVDVVLRQETQLTEHLRLISTKVDFLNHVDESEGGEPLVTEGFARAEFERGRQQGDADRAQRGVSEFERGVTMGRANREAELLDQGWTPPGDATREAIDWSRKVAQADIEGYRRGSLEGATHTLEVTSGPTDYEVWRDALTLATNHINNPDEYEGENHRKTALLTLATWFRTQLTVQIEEHDQQEAEDIFPTETPAAADPDDDPYIDHI